jgi:hypothetical protein
LIHQSTTSLKTKTGLPFWTSHGNPVHWFLLRQPGYPNLGIRGFPSHDYSWFGFIELLYLLVIE